MSASKPSNQDGNILKYLVLAHASSTEVAMLSSLDSDDDQTQEQAEPDENQALIQPFAFYSSDLEYITK